MRNLLSSLLLAFSLAACDTAGSIFSEGTFTDQGADTIIQADTPADRGLRACLATTVISELISYRVLWFESTAEDRAQAQFAMASLLKAVQAVRGGLQPSPEDPFWFETEMFYVIVGLIHGVGEPLTDHVLGTVADALTGNVGDLITTFRVRAGQAALARFMIEDIKRYFEREHTTEWLDNGWAMCEARVQANIAKLQ